MSRTLKKLNVKSAGGPDCVPPIFLSKCCNNLAYPIAFIFQLFFNNSFLPDIWRKAYVTPVFKKGDSTQVCNYRPISLTCSHTVQTDEEYNQRSTTASPHVEGFH